jgi:hypothetical protein
MAKATRRNKQVAVIAAAAVFLLVVSACSSGVGTSAAEGSAPADPDAHFLANYAGGGERSFARILNRTAPHCRESRHKLSAMFYGTWKVAQSDGLPDGLLSIAQHVSGSIPAKARGWDCTGIAAAYLVLREKG